MRSLARAAMEGMGDLVPLPHPFRAFQDAGARIYRGEVTEFAGPSGSMKTILALNCARVFDVPSLYFSNDSTMYTIVARSLAMLTGFDFDRCERIVKDHPEQAYKVLRGWDNIRFDFHSSPNIERLCQFGEGFREMYGEYPQATFVDIAMNMDHDGVEAQQYWDLFKELKKIAKEWSTAVIVMHHTREGGENKYNPCPPKSAVFGKADQVPATIFTQVGQGDQILFACVKNRNGRQDPSGQTYYRLAVDPAKCKVWDELRPIGQEKASV